MKSLNSLLNFTPNIAIYNEICFKSDQDAFNSLVQKKINAQNGPQTLEAISGFNSRVQKATWFSRIVEDNNDRNVRWKDDPAYKRVYLKLAYKKFAKHLTTSYDFVQIDKGHNLDNFWVFCPEQYTHAEKDDLTFLNKARRLKLNNYKFTENNYTINAQEYEAVNCIPHNSFMKVHLPNCEVLKLTLLRP